MLNKWQIGWGMRFFTSLAKRSSALKSPWASIMAAHFWPTKTA
ncbi:hypothetical protein PPHE_a2083 [Pseudoalteromonas phenolica O-BC30]|nr:hypothetical protein [Pseudoalteromonas phenolica O-BC30]